MSLDAPPTTVFRDATQVRGALGVQGSFTWERSHASDMRRLSGSRIATLLGQGFGGVKAATEEWFTIFCDERLRRDHGRRWAASLRGRSPTPKESAACRIGLARKQEIAAYRRRFRASAAQTLAGRRYSAMRPLSLAARVPAVAKGNATEDSIREAVEAKLLTRILPGGVYTTHGSRYASLDGEMLLVRADGSGVDAAVVELKSKWKPPTAYDMYVASPTPAYVFQCQWNMYITGARVAVLGVAYRHTRDFGGDPRALDAWEAQCRISRRPLNTLRLWTLWPDPELMEAIECALGELFTLVECLVKAEVPLASASALTPFVDRILHRYEQWLAVGVSRTTPWSTGLDERWTKGSLNAESQGLDVPESHRAPPDPVPLTMKGAPRALRALGLA